MFVIRVIIVSSFISFVGNACWQFVVFWWIWIVFVPLISAGNGFTHSHFSRSLLDLVRFVKKVNGYHGDGDSLSPFDGDGFVKVACIFWLNVSKKVSKRKKNEVQVSLIVE